MAVAADEADARDLVCVADGVGGAVVPPRVPRSTMEPPEYKKAYLEQPADGKGADDLPGSLTRRPSYISARVRGRSWSRRSKEGALLPVEVVELAGDFAVVADPVGPATVPPRVPRLFMAAGIQEARVAPW